MAAGGGAGGAQGGAQGGAGRGGGGGEREGVGVCAQETVTMTQVVLFIAPGTTECGDAAVTSKCVSLHRLTIYS